MNFGPTHLKKMFIDLPPEKERKTFEELVRPLIEKTILIKIENKKLLELRDGLLPRLLSGKLDVSLIEK